MTKLYRVLGDILQMFDGLLVLEKQKIDAVVAGDVHLLDGFMKEEQAFMLKLRGLDQQREEAQKQLGLQGLTLRQIMEKAEGPDRERLEAFHTHLSGKTSELNKTITLAKEYIDAHVRKFELLLANAGRERASGYQSTRQRVAGDAPRFTSENI